MKVPQTSSDFQRGLRRNDGSLRVNGFVFSYIVLQEIDPVKLPELAKISLVTRCGVLGIFVIRVRCHWSSDMPLYLYLGIRIGASIGYAPELPTGELMIAKQERHAFWKICANGRRHPSRDHWVRMTIATKDYGWEGS